MEGKAEETDLSFFFHFFKIRDQTEIQHQLPFFLIQTVEKIKIYIVGLETVQLFLEQAFGIVQGFYVPDGKLGCKEKTAAVVFLQHTPYKRLTVAVVIRISSVNVADACLDGCIQHFLRFWFTDTSVQILRKTHTAESQKGRGNPKFFKLTILHKINTSYCCL